MAIHILYVGTFTSENLRDVSYLPILTALLFIVGHKFFGPVLDCAGPQTLGSETMVEYNSDLDEKSLETKLAEMTRRAEKAEVEVARLTAERDWLAKVLTARDEDMTVDEWILAASMAVVVEEDA